MGWGVWADTGMTGPALRVSTDPWVLGTALVSDVLIALSYFSIPAVIGVYYLRRPSMAHRRLALLISLFLLACGLTHVMDVWVLWQPSFGWQSAGKVLTAVIAVLTAVRLWPLLPQMLKIPSIRQLGSAIDLLETEVRKRMSVEEHLLDTEQSLAITLNSIGAGFIKTDALGRIKRINGVALALTGIGADRAHDQALSDILQLAPEAPDEQRALFDRIERLAGRQERTHVVTLQAVDGRRTTVELRAALNCNAHDEVTGMTLLMRDLTALRQAEEARQKTLVLEAENQQIQEANRIKTLFLANMSHELRTPLNAIIGFAELLESGAVPPESPKHGQFLGHISNSGQHLLRLINDVLDLSKVDAGKLAFTPQTIDLAATLADVQAQLQTGLADKQLRLVAQIDPNIGPVTIDPGRFRQVLYNYLSNAIKFTPEAGTIAIRVLPAGPERFRVEVEDSGIGISEADMPRLFQEFQQLDSSFTRKHQGTGLGLALTKRLVEAQGGSVGASSIAGQGSVFHLVLPRVTQAVDPS